MGEDINSLEIVLSNAKTYEDIQERRTQGFTDIEKALGIVREFIIRKKRILYGGMSIDISLRLADHPGIYADNAIPDYDFYSPDIEGDSNEIADILHKAGFEGVFARNAQHATTRRVKINFANVVADVSYIPKEIYDHIPTQMYKGMRVTHPIFQWMDMHRALSQPFEKPPWEVIAHRVYKDIKRYKLLYGEYGVPYKKDYVTKFGISAKPEDSLEIDITRITGKSKNESYMIGGYQGYAILHSFLFYMIDSKSVFYETLRDVGTLNSIKDLLDQSALATFRSKGTRMTFEFPKNKSHIGLAHKRAVIISDNFPVIADTMDKNMFSGKAKREYYEMYGDYLRPRTIILSDDRSNILYEIFDNLGHIQPGYNLKDTLTVLHKINPSTKDLMSSSDRMESVWITGPQNIVLYALQKYHDYNTPEAEKEYHLYMYQSGIWLIQAAEMVVNTLRNASGVDQKGFVDMYKKLPFFLTTQSYGKENWSADYLSLMYHKTYIIEGVPGNQQKKTRPPFAYYPDKPYPDEKFDLESSPMFQMSGKKVKGPFKAISLDPNEL